MVRRNRSPQPPLVIFEGLRDVPLMRKTHATALLTIGLLGLGLVGCTPIVAQRGNLVEDSRLAQIQSGQTTREQVQYVLGTPTSTGTVDGSTWYYIGRRTAQTAFLDPEVTAQRIVRVRFDAEGTVQEVKELDGNDAVYIAPVARVTPTVGHDLGFFEQLLGNLSKPTRKKKKEDKKR
jgi:outer membrane protein assembly factor BamE (lipoprotein component of BamABCDE complex)